MAQGIDLYKKVQAMKTSPKSDERPPSSQRAAQSPSPSAQGAPLASSEYSMGDRNSGMAFIQEIQKKQGLLKEAQVPVIGDKGLDHVAKFLLLLGREEAGKILRNLSAEEVEKICEKITQIKRVDSVEAQTILQEFGFLKEAKADRSTGGIGTARDILTAAFGAKKGEEILRETVPESRPTPFSFLNDVELPQLLNLIKDESPLVLTVLLSSLPSQKASQIIKALDNETRTTVLLRMGRMEKIDHNTIALMEEKLMERLNQQGKMETIELDGPNKLASILKFMPLSKEKEILDDLATTDEKLSKDVKEQLFTIDSVRHMRDEDLQKILQEFAEKDIAKLLRAKDEEIQTRILTNLSTRRRQFVEEESILMGSIPRTEADEITKGFLDHISRKEEAGEIVIMREEEDYI